MMNQAQIPQHNNLHSGSQVNPIGNQNMHQCEICMQFVEGSKIMSHMIECKNEIIKNTKTDQTSHYQSKVQNIPGKVFPKSY